MRVQLLTWEVSFERVRATTAEVATAYNKVAHVWDDKIHRLGFDRAYRDLFARLQAMLLPDSNLPEEERARGIPVLDCGIGTGALSLALHQETTAKVWLHGVDVSPEMVTQARHHLVEHGVFPLVEPRDIRRLTYPDDKFALVMSAHTLEHLPDPREGLREMIRVLRPDAPLLLIMTQRSFLGSLLDAKWGLNCVDQDTLRQWLTEAGLVNIEFHQLGGPIWCRRMSIACTAWKSAGHWV